MSSKMATYVFDVVRGTREGILEVLDQAGYADEETAIRILKQQFGVVARRHDRTEGTIRNACTRELGGLKTQGFASAAIRQITGQSDELLGRLMDHCKNIKGDDNKFDMPGRMNKILKEDEKWK